MYVYIYIVCICVVTAVLLCPPPQNMTPALPLPPPLLFIYTSSKVIIKYLAKIIIKRNFCTVNCKMPRCQIIGTVLHSVLKLVYCIKDFETAAFRVLNFVCFIYNIKTLCYILSNYLSLIQPNPTLSKKIKV